MKNFLSLILCLFVKDAGIRNELIIVPGAPHYGKMFDADYIREKIFRYLKEFLR